MTRKRNNRIGIALACLGLAIFLVELGFYWWKREPITPIPVSAAAILFFVGGAITNFERATAIANVVVGSGVTIISALRGGRRETDKLADKGETVVIPPTGEHLIPATPNATPPAPLEPPLPVPPAEHVTDTAAPDPNASVGGIL